LPRVTAGEFKAAKKVVGIKQTAKSLEKDAVRLVFIAADADRRIVEPLTALCGKKSVPVEEVESMKELGRLCGIQVGAAAAAFLRG
jgi:large subunit ribosomal protein L7A